MVAFVCMNPGVDFLTRENDNEQSNYSSSKKPLRLLQKESQRDVIYGNYNLIYIVETQKSSVTRKNERINKVKTVPKDSKIAYHALSPNLDVSDFNNPYQQIIDTPNAHNNSYLLPPGRKRFLLAQLLNVLFLIFIPLYFCHTVSQNSFTFISFRSMKTTDQAFESSYFLEHFSPDNAS